MGYIRWKVEKSAAQGLAWMFGVVLVVTVGLVVIGAILAAVIVGVVLLGLVWLISGLYIKVYNRTQKPENRILLTKEARVERQRLREEKKAEKKARRG